MSIIFGTGWEMGASLSTLPNVVLVTGTAATTVSTTEQNTGSYSIRIAQTGSWDYYPTDTLNEFYVSTYFRSNSSTRMRMLFYANGSIAVELRHTNGNAIELLIGGVSVATGSITYDTLWHNVQAYIKLDDTVGVIQIKIDGVLDVNYSGDTQPGVDPIDRIRLYCDSASYGYYDDFILVDAAHGWPGRVLFEKLTPNADDIAEWTPSSGVDNYAMIDEASPSTSDYVRSVTDGDEDLYGLSTWTGTNKVPVMVNVFHFATADGAGNQGIKQKTVSGTTELVTSKKTVPNNTRTYLQLVENDPNGGAWSEASINALKIGQLSVFGDS